MPRAAALQAVNRNLKRQTCAYRSLYLYGDVQKKVEATIALGDALLERQELSQLPALG